MGFRHEAMLYAGQEQFVAATSSFLREGLAVGERALVMVSAEKIDALRDELAEDAGGVEFADMGVVGKNPSRIIPAWREFATANAGGPLRGVGEPIGPHRDDCELVECQHHESLLNLAFADAGDFRLICPYDAEALPPAVIDEARRSHPTVMVDGDVRDSALYRGDHHAGAGLGSRLPEPPPAHHILAFGPGDLGAVRGFAARQAERDGLSECGRSDVVLAVNELAANTVKHAGGHGILRGWRDGDSLVFEVSDAGRIHEPLVGRHTPELGQLRGRGLWLVNQVCDLVQVRSTDAGTVVRLHMAAA